LAAKSPPAKEELRVFTRFTETFSANELAEWGKKVGDEVGFLGDDCENPLRAKRSMI